MRKKDGLVRMIFLIIIAILVLSYLRVDLRGLVNSDLTQNNVGFFLSLVQNIWYNYIKTPIIFILNWVLHIIQ